MNHRTLDRSRIGAFLTALVTLLGLFATTSFLAFVMHDRLGFAPAMTGAAFLPLVASIVFAALLVPTRLLPVAGAKSLLTAGLLLCAGAHFWLSFLPLDATYAVHLLGPLLLMGLGLGTAVSTAIAAASPTGDAARRVGASTLAGLLAIVAARSKSACRNCSSSRRCNRRRTSSRASCRAA